MLGSCKQCGKSVSDKAVHCPHCGLATPFVFSPPREGEHRSDEVGPREPGQGNAEVFVLAAPRSNEVAAPTGGTTSIFWIGFSLLLVAVVFVLVAMQHETGSVAPAEQIETEQIETQTVTTFAGSANPSDRATSETFQSPITPARSTSSVESLPPATNASPPRIEPGSVYTRATLTCGIVLSYPTHWTVLSRSDDLNIQARVQAEGVGPDPGRETLLLMNSSPEPHGAQLRLKLTAETDPTAQVLLDVVHDDEMLQLWTDQLRVLFEQSTLIHLVQIRPAEIVRVSSRPAIHMSYNRSALNSGEADWRVDQYKIPLGQHLLHVTISYRTSEEKLYAPILDSVLASLDAGSGC